MGQHKFNVHAPIFIPGQLWIKHEHQSLCAVPFAHRHNGLAGRPDATTSLVEYTSVGTGTNKPTGASTSIESSLQLLQQWINSKRRVIPRIDNTAWAVEARFVFDRCFGTDASNLRAWQDLCFFCGQQSDGMPMTVFECKKWLGTIYVNIFDLVEAVQTYTVVDPYFDNAQDLEIYSRQTGKMCPAMAAKGNAIFSFLLRRWF